MSKNFQAEIDRRTEDIEAEKFIEFSGDDLEKLTNFTDAEWKIFITGEIVRGEKISDTIVGYVSYMELLNGFRKSLYMTLEEIQAHAEKYSQSYAYDLRSGKKSSVWSTNFDAMAKKTVLKRLLSGFGIMSIDQKSADLATALQADQAVITEGGLRYIDNEPDGEEKIVPFDDIIGVDKNSDDTTEDN